jgi:hypothetical protein
MVVIEVMEGLDSPRISGKTPVVKGDEDGNEKVESRKQKTEIQTAVSGGRNGSIADRPVAPIPAFSFSSEPTRPISL